MKIWTKAFIPGFAAAVMMGMPCMSQDVETPFRWEGEGTASFISQAGTAEIKFKFELSVDEQGIVEGKASNEEGSSRIKHVFYTERKQYDLPGLFSRDLIIVLMFDEYGDNPMLTVLNGRILVDRFLYGEVMLARYEEGGDTAKAFGIGNPQATLMAGDDIPNSLRLAMNKCLPIGIVKIEGDYSSKEASGAAGGESATAESQDGGSVALFDERDLRDGHIYLTDADADPKDVWKVQDGVLLCKGEPTAFLRTKEQYSDYRLVLEWRWPEKPGNSGVLLHMSGEEKIWPLCVEAQLMHTRAGDLVGMGCDFNENKAEKGGPVSYTPRMNDSNEKEPGGWNTYEIVCKGNTIELTVNGQLQNRATGVSIRKGYIGLQSEGVPIMFRNIRLMPLKGGSGMAATRAVTARVDEKVTPTKFRGAYFVNGEIHVNTYGTPEGKPLTSGHQDFKPSWSKSGDMLVFFRRLKNDPVVTNWKTAICIINVDGTDLRKLTDGTHTDFNPTWTRDGSNTPIWNRKNPETGSFCVMQSKVGNSPGQEVALTDKRYHTWAYTCLKDGRILVQSAPPEQGYGYFLMTPNTTGKPRFERIDCELAKKGLLDRVSVSPSEKMVCFEYQIGFDYKDAGRTLYIADFDAGKPSIINAKPFANEERANRWFAYPRWTKDETAIVYHASPSLYLYTLKDGSTKKVSTNDRADYRYPHCEATPK